MVGQFRVVRVDAGGRPCKGIWVREVLSLELGECGDSFRDVPCLGDHVSDRLGVVDMMMVCHVMSLVVRSILAVGGKCQCAVVLLYNDLDRDIIPGNDPRINGCLGWCEKRSIRAPWVPCV